MDSREFALTSIIAALLLLSAEAAALSPSQFAPRPFADGPARAPVAGVLALAQSSDDPPDDDDDDDNDDIDDDADDPGADDPGADDPGVDDDV